jgi:delta1-piperideine-2-carboxylate reductase
MSDKTYFTFETLNELIQQILLKAGVSPCQSKALAKVIVAGEGDACKSHGVYRVEGVLRTVRAGKVNPTAVPVLQPDAATAIVRVDAQGGFANAAFDIGLPELVARTRQLGVATLVINNCCHFSALWPEIEALTDHGLAAMIMCPSYTSVAPSGGDKPLLGTNPFAFGWPRPSGNPYVFDFATSVAARGEIELLRRAGKPLPEGWAIDVNGQPTTDPEAALAGAMLPFGGHKGSAISTMIELMAAIMIGDRTSPEALAFTGSTTLAPVHGELIMAFDPARFAQGRPGNPLDRAEVLFDAILGTGARLPSQRRFMAREKSKAEGIALNADEIQILQQLLDQTAP